jgi:hypothetical protein
MGELMTDLSENGKNLVLSSASFLEDRREEYVRSLIEHTPVLAEALRHINEKAVERQLDQIADALIKKRINAYADVFFLVVKPDSTFEIYIADLDYTRQVKTGLPFSAQFVRDNVNKYFYKAFLELLQDVRSLEKKSHSTNGESVDRSS